MAGTKYPAVKGRNSRGFTDWVYPDDHYRLQCCACLTCHHVEFRVVRDVGGKPVKVNDRRLRVAFRVKGLDRETRLAQNGRR